MEKGGCGVGKVCVRGGVEGRWCRCRVGRVCVRGGVEMRCEIDGTKRRGCMRGMVLKKENL